MVLGRARSSWSAAAAAAVLVLLATGMLTGCGGQTVTSTARSASPTATSRPWYAQPLSAPAGSPGVAARAATAAVDADQAAITEILELKVPPQAISDFEGGARLTTMGQYLDTLGDTATPAPVSGPASKWLPDPTRTSVTYVRAAGKVYKYGKVTMTGCFDIRASVFLYVSDRGQVTAPYPTDFVPYTVTTEYDPSEHVWLVTGETFLASAAGTSVCPPSNS